MTIDQLIHKLAVMPGHAEVRFVSDVAGWCANAIRNSAGMYDTQEDLAASFEDPDFIEVTDEVLDISLIPDPGAPTFDASGNCIPQVHICLNNKWEI